MDSALLIDSIVRQTTVLIASLATASGQRTQLAHIANLVFADLVRELRQQGLANRVISDMFGLALRTYRRKLARLSESHTDRGRSLWEAALHHIQQHGPLSRAQVLQRFGRDDPEVLRSVLRDLIDSGLVLRQGNDDAATLRTAPIPDPDTAGVDPEALLESLVLVALHRGGPQDLSALQAQVPATLQALQAALTRLVEQGLCALEQSGPQRTYRCNSCVIGFGDEAGWEAAVFDHYQAMVTALVNKLRAGTRKAALDDRIGGSTFVFDLWQGHPLQSQAEGYLREMRERGMALRKELAAYAADCPRPEGAEPLRVVAYVGQSVIGLEEEDE